MRYLKLYTLFLGLGLLTSCGNDDPDYNSTAATVSFGESTLAVRETSGVVRIPLTVEGEQNGLIKVNATASNATAEEDKDFYVTQKTVVLPAGGEEGFIEVRVVHDGVITGERKFTVELASAEGASLGQAKSCEVTIVEVDDKLYYQMLGTWTLTAVSAFDGTEVVGKVTLSNGSTPGEQELNDNDQYLCTGFFNGSVIMQANPAFVWNMKFDEASETVTIIKSYKSIEGVNFGDELGECTVFVEPLTSSGAAAPESPVPGKISTDKKTVTFNGYFGESIYSPKIGGFAGVATAYTSCVMTKD